MNSLLLFVIGILIVIALLVDAIQTIKLTKRVIEYTEELKKRFNKN